eukprot:2207-Lingulodinium_polyedra.AAC.1
MEWNGMERDVERSVFIQLRSEIINEMRQLRKQIDDTDWSRKAHAKIQSWWQHLDSLQEFASGKKRCSELPEILQSEIKRMAFIK